VKLGSVIGRVTLSHVVPELRGARWLIVSPFTREHFQRGSESLAGVSKDPSLVVYDSLGGGVGQTIGYVEGREAAQPFEIPPPIDAINAALVDDIFYNPF
jgi:carbon dioxide concentrating mechanism protein CcmL